MSNACQTCQTVGNIDAPCPHGGELMSDTWGQAPINVRCGLCGGLCDVGRLTTGEPVIVCRNCAARHQEQPSAEVTQYTDVCGVARCTACDRPPGEYHGCPYCTPKEQP